MYADTRLIEQYKKNIHIDFHLQDLAHAVDTLFPLLFTHFPLPCILNQIEPKLFRFVSEDLYILFNVKTILIVLLV